jgi:hypothetical protein
VTCETCKDTFAALAALEAEGRNNERARLLDEREPECRCESASISEYSPEAVQDAEVLIRIIVAPQHVTKSGGPRAAALSDAERTGLSVFRDGHASNDEILGVARELVARAKRSHGDKAGVRGVLQIECRAFRAFRRDGEKPSYCVYDTALEQRISHAEAFQRISNVDEAIRDARRSELFGQIKAGFIPVDKFRGGLLKDLAPVGA